MTAAVMNQQSFRGRNDDNDEVNATWKATTNTNWTQAVDVNFRVRFLIQETAGGMNNNVTPQLEYNLGGAGWNAVNASSSVVRSSTSANFTDDDDTTQQLVAGSFISPNEGMDDDNGLAGEGLLMDFNGNECEAEFCAQIRGADVADGNTIQLRVTNGGTAFGNYTNTPTVTVSESTTLTFEATPGTLTLAGINADVLQQVFYESQPGALALSGVAADFTQNFCYESQTGALLLAGPQATVETTYNYESQAGALKLSGIAADQVITESDGSVTYESVAGSLKLAGLNADLLLEIFYESQPGTIKLTGVAADQVIAGSVGYESVAGQLKLTGLKGDFVIPSLAAAWPTVISGVRRSTYPRRVQIDGKRYTVRSEHEYRDLLESLLAEQQAKAERAKETKRPVRQIRLKIKRTKARIQKLDEPRADPRRIWDEELLLMMVDDPWL